MQLYFIRHAESANNRLYLDTGTSQGRSEDPELTPLGRQQAQHLAQRLANPALYLQSSLSRRFYPADQVPTLTHLYCSLMVRAVETAQTAAQTLGLPVQAWPDLHETGGIYLDMPNGSLDTTMRMGQPGKPRSYFTQHYPGLQLPAEVSEQGWWNRPFEEEDARVERANRVLGDLLVRHAAPCPDGTEERVAVVSHGGFYNYFIRVVLGLPPRQRINDLSDTWFELNNTAITRLDYHNGSWLVAYLNRVDDLPLEMIT
jgi:2,3-bisphosphoglycerate-dependent phosphoglycerate mutase